jgi:hypothetical protein
MTRRPGPDTCAHCRKSTYRVLTLDMGTVCMECANQLVPIATSEVPEPPRKPPEVPSTSNCTCGTCEAIAASKARHPSHYVTSEQVELAAEDWTGFDSDLLEAGASSFLSEVQALTASGASYEEAAQAVASTQPALWDSYRQHVSNN